MGKALLSRNANRESTPKVIQRSNSFTDTQSYTEPNPVSIAFTAPVSTLLGILLPVAICAFTLGCSRDSVSDVWSAAELAENYDEVKKSDAYPVDIPSGGYFVRNIKGRNIKPPKL